MENIFTALDQLINQEGSDVHIIPGSPLSLRINGKLIAPYGEAPLTADQTKALIFPIFTQEQKDFVTVNKELDFGYQYKNLGRFRVNAYHALGGLAAALRLIPNEIKTIDQLGLPSIFHDFSRFSQGLVLLTGPTGEGKSTTLAAIINEINLHRSEHVVTIEDPIEFIYHPAKSIISQREINSDTNGWDVALRSVLREDPDVVLIGEMRDFETIAAAITIAETGHLVFATLHTNTAAETLDRIVDVFPAGQQAQVRQQLASTIKVVAAQRLLPTVNDKRVVAVEILLANNAVRNLIREGKAHQIDSVMQTASDEGMILFENYLQILLQRGIITKQTALSHAFRPKEMQRVLKSFGTDNAQIVN